MFDKPNRYLHRSGTPHMQVVDIVGTFLQVDPKCLTLISTFRETSLIAPGCDLPQSITLLNVQSVLVKMRIGDVDDISLKWLFATIYDETDPYVLIDQPQGVE